MKEDKVIKQPQIKAEEALKLVAPKEGLVIIALLEEAGYEAYFIGGCVRDTVMGNVPKDWDICTNARPEEMVKCLSCCKLLDTGINYGTLTAIYGGEVFEVTTYRIDGEYENYRHPRSVFFTDDLNEDLSRRDFTINAVAYNPKTGIYDLFGGMRDINSKLIRCVGVSEHRFEEDALRILRCLRFASSLGFVIEQETSSALKVKKCLLNAISLERIRVELDGILCGVNAEQVCREYRDVLAKVVPEIIPSFDFDQCSPYHIYDVWEHTLHTLNKIGNEPVLRLAALFHDLGKPSCFTLDVKGVGHFYGNEEKSTEIATEVMSRLKYDKKTTQMVQEIVRKHGLILEPTLKFVKRRLNKMGKEALKNLIELELADVGSQNPKHTYERVARIEEFREIMESVLRDELCFTLDALDVNGSDLIAQGMEPGPDIGRILKILLEEVLDEKLENTKRDLLERSQELIG